MSTKMKHRIKNIIRSIFVITFFCFVQQSCKNAKTEQYFGLDDSAFAEIRLTLAPDQTFLMTRRLENKNVQEHPKLEILKGDWVKEGKLLKLTSTDKNIIVYELTNEKSVIAGQEFIVETYVFKSDVKDFFGSQIDINLDMTN